MASTLRPPVALSILVRAAEPIDDGKAITFAANVIELHGGLRHEHMLTAAHYVEELLADPSVANADLKGLLRRLGGPVWGIEFEFGADAKAARRYLEALKQAIARELK